MICNQCGCKVPDGIGRCRVCGSEELVVSRSAPPMSPSFSRAADLGPAPSRVPAAVPPVGGVRQCPTCGRPLTLGARFCNGCGTNVAAVAAPVPAGSRCGSCGRPVATGAKFCNGCGARVLAPVTPAPVPAPVPVAPAPAPVPVEMPAPVVEPAPVPQEPPVSFAPAFVPAPVPEEVPVVEPEVAPMPEPVPAPVAEEPAVAEPVAEKRCLVCGQALPMDSKFCRHCGATWMNAPMEESVEEPVVAPAPEKLPEVPEDTAASVKICLICGKELAAGAKFCNGCGANVESVPATVPQETAPQTRLCHICGKELAMGVRFCNSCGADMESAPPVKVTDPIINDEKKPKKTKAKKEKPAGKKSKKGLVIGIVIALVVILAAAAVTVFVFDPFDWFGKAAETEIVDDDAKAEDVALDMLEAFYSFDTDGVTATIHDSVLEGYAEEKGQDRDEYVEVMRGMLEMMEGQLAGCEISMEVSDTKDLGEDELEELEQTYSDQYDLELEDAREVCIQLSATYEGESRSNELTILVVKIDGQWYSDPKLSDMD